MNANDYKTLLLERKSELISHSEKSKETRAPVELDQTRQGRISRQDALMQQEMARATERSRNLEIIKIESALKRIETGDFGYCVACDEKIPEARLNNDPATPSCVHCASKSK